MIGYRIWYIHGHNLHGIYQLNYIWQPDINVTELPPIKKRDINIINPNMQNDEYWGSGFHAFKEEVYAFVYFKTYCEKNYPFAFGSIWMWGDVIETQRGYRASHAEIRSIDFVHLGMYNNIFTPLEILDSKYHDKFVCVRQTSYD